MIKDAQSRLKTTEESAKYLKVGRDSFWTRFIETRMIPVVAYDKVQKAPLFDINDLDKFIDEHKGYYNPSNEEDIITIIKNKKKRCDK